MKKIVDLLPDKEEFCLLVKSAFSNDFCERLIHRNKNSFKKAITHYPTSYRSNERQIIDSKRLSENIFSKIESYIPKQFNTKGISDYEEGSWGLKKLNSRIRICRYLPNQYFNKHLDGVFYESENEQSKLTFMIYLNNHDEFLGGKTLFFNSKEDEKIMADYKPIKGDLIIFDHNLWHSGEVVQKGQKYILRSDIIYEKLNDKSLVRENPYNEGHLGYIWRALSCGENLITSGRDKKIKIWDKKGNKISEFLAHKNSIISLLKLNGNMLISGSRDKSIKIWDVNNLTNVFLNKKLNYHNGTVLDLCKRNEFEFLSSGADGVVNLISVNKGLMKKIKAHDEWVWGGSIIKENYFITISEDGSMIVWSLMTFRKIFIWKERKPINSLVIKGSSVYLGMFDGVIIKLKICFQSKKIEKVKEKKCHDGIIRKLKLDTSFLYSVSEDSTLKTWCVNSLMLKKVYKHDNFVQDVALCKKHFISVSYDGRIRKYLKS